MRGYSYKEQGKSESTERLFMLAVCPTLCTLGNKLVVSFASSLT